MRIVTAAALTVLGVVAVVTTSVSGPASAAAAAARPTTVPPTAARPTAARSAAPIADDLVDVACRTSKNCMAVGALGSYAAVAAWNGTAWHSVGVNPPGGVPAGGLSGVACPETSECVAVGDVFPTVGQGYNYALGGSWNGKAWAPTQVSESAGSVLGAVSCLSAKSCLAVGDDHSPTGGYQSPIAYAWNGAHWNALAVPAQPFNDDTAFTGVSCVTGRFCMVAGYSPTSTGALTTLLYRWNGRTWTALKPAAPPKGVANLMMGSVSCASPTSCVAVGDGSDKAGDVAVAEVWNGRAWRVTAPIAWPKGTTNPEATDVSCATARYCVTTGFIDSSTNRNDYGYTGRAAASVWNGKTWRATAVAAPGKGKSSAFGGVTCLRPTFCAAVGSTEAYDAAPGTGTALSAFWNGKGWRLVGLK